MQFARNNAVVRWLEKTLAARKETVIQDIEVPIHNAEAFHHFFHQQVGVKPVWMCPVQNYNSEVKYAFYALLPNTLYVNFGFWDAVPSGEPEGHYNKLIEGKVGALAGHKSLYSDVYYSEDEFWQIYDQSHYRKIKQKYDPKGGLKDWYKKVTGK